MRRALDAVDRWERGMKEALYANGMIGGDDLNRELDTIRDHANSLRGQLLSTDPSTEAEYDDFSAPYPATAEAEPVGS